MKNRLGKIPVFSLSVSLRTEWGFFVCNNRNQNEDSFLQYIVLDGLFWSILMEKMFIESQVFHTSFCNQPPRNLNIWDRRQVVNGGIGVLRWKGACRYLPTFDGKNLDIETAYARAIICKRRHRGIILLESGKDYLLKKDKWYQLSSLVSSSRKKQPWWQ